MNKSLTAVWSFEDDIVVEAAKYYIKHLWSKV